MEDPGSPALAQLLSERGEMDSSDIALIFLWVTIVDFPVVSDDGVL